jgi:hypothetical protein
MAGYSPVAYWNIFLGTAVLAFEALRIGARLSGILGYLAFLFSTAGTRSPFNFSSDTFHRLSAADLSENQDNGT